MRSTEPSAIESPTLRKSPSRMGDYGRFAKEAVPVLLITLKDQSTFGEVREAAASALGKIDPNDPEVIKALTAALKDKRKGVQKAAASALKKSG